MTDQIVVSRSAGVCEVRLNRPEKRNALTLAMYAALCDAIDQAERDETIQVILLSGAGAGFTAGNDLADFLAGPEMNELHSTARFVRLLPEIRKVLVAAIHGTTVGIGVTLLLHCDLVIAAQSTRLSMPFVKLGLVPEAASSLLLPRLVGPQRAAELLLLGETFDARQAAMMGLANRVVEDEQLMDTARALAQRLAAQPPQALRASKRLLKNDLPQIRARIEEELAWFAQLLRSPDFRAAAQAFLTKRRPPPTGGPPGDPPSRG